jgi:WXG100 family type VII secretion target
MIKSAEEPVPGKLTAISLGGPAMPPNKVRADYDSLRQIAQRFGQLAEETRTTLRNLEQAANTLKQGDWIGEGARKFYDEFDSTVLPSLKRLQSALENAGQATKKMDDVMRQAEELAARLFSLLGAAASSSAARARGAEGANGSPVQQTQAEASEARLNENGITIHSSGNCRDRNNRRCTSVEGMRQETQDGLVAFRNAVGVDLVMTGGTEVGHSAGEFSHANGYKADVSLNPTVNRYIEDNFEHTGQRSSDGAELYRDPNGNVFARESNHWDITFH